MAEIITKAPGINARSLHPIGLAGKKMDGDDEGKFVRCKQCGFIVNKDINKKGSGYGNEVITGSGSTIDISVASGCPLCGSSEYE